MKKTSIGEIFKIFFIIGIQLLGGGYVIVPLLKKYIVDERQWLTEEELVDFYAMSQCIPGIIACNIATAAGYKTRGFWGALSALLGIITPPFFAIIALANILTNIIDSEIVKNAFWGIRIAVIVLVFLTVKDIWKNCVNSIFCYVLFFLILVCFIVLPVSPTILIITSALLALLFGKIKGENNA